MNSHACRNPIAKSFKDGYYCGCAFMLTCSLCDEEWVDHHEVRMNVRKCVFSPGYWTPREERDYEVTAKEA